MIVSHEECMARCAKVEHVSLFSPIDVGAGIFSDSTVKVCAKVGEKKNEYMGQDDVRIKIYYFTHTSRCTHNY